MVILVENPRGSHRECFSNPVLLTSCVDWSWGRSLPYQGVRRTVHEHGKFWQGAKQEREREKGSQSESVGKLPVVWNWQGAAGPLFSSSPCQKLPRLCTVHFAPQQAPILRSAYTAHKWYGIAKSLSVGYSWIPNYSHICWQLHYHRQVSLPSLR